MRPRGEENLEERRGGIEKQHEGRAARKGGRGKGVNNKGGERGSEGVKRNWAEISGCGQEVGGGG